MGLHTRCVSGICAGLVCLGATGEPVLPLPAIPGVLMDEAHLLSIDEARELRKTLEEIQDTTGTTVAVLVVQSTQPEPVEDYVERLAQAWFQKGGLDPEQSVFIVLALKDRQFDILPGLALPQLKAHLIDGRAFQDVVVLLRQERHFDALLRASLNLLELLRKQRARS